VEEAANGPEGVEKILQFRPAVALVDIGLPAFDGLEVTRRVRARTEEPEARPLLGALTDYGPDTDRNAPLAADLDPHRTHPASPPGFDGLEVARRVRARTEDPGARPLLVALTGYGLDTDRNAALAAGFDRHLTKPVSPQQLTQLFQGGRPAR